MYIIYYILCNNVGVRRYWRFIIHHSTMIIDHQTASYTCTNNDRLTDRRQTTFHFASTKEAFTLTQIRFSPLEVYKQY